jgi:PEGA domain-containing protein
MNTASVPVERPEAPLFSDGLGDRVVAVDGATGDLLQILRLRPELLAVPSFEFALRERAARLANFRHAYYARVRRIDRQPTGLAVVSDHAEGVRLSEILRVAQERRLHLDLNAALCLLRQLVPSVALLHENARDVAHGLIAPERLIVTPRARLVIVEHVLGSAVEQLRYGRERLWQEFRVALPVTAVGSRFDHRADVAGIGMVALALVLGRPLEAGEYPDKIASLVNDARALSTMGDEQPLPAALRTWLSRVLQLEPRTAIATASDALAALEDALSDDLGFVAAPVALETFLSRYISAMLEPIEEQSAPAPAPRSLVSNTFVAGSSVATPPPVVQQPVAPPPPEPAAAIVERESVIVPEPTAFEPVGFEPMPSEQLNAQPAVPEPPQQARDITELLKDFAIETPPAKASEPVAPPPQQKAVWGRQRIGNWRRIAVIALAIVAVGGGAVIAARNYRKPVPPKMGTLSVQSNPPGVAVFVDGVSRGNTPARLSLTAGSHIVELRGRGVPRVVPVTVAAGTESSQYLELPQTPTTGSLLVQSEPAGARVSIDGTERGIAPVNIADLAPGPHDVTLQANGGAPVRQHVVIEAGVTSSVLAPVATAAPGPVSGWLAVKAPVTIEVHENGKLIGTTDSDRIMMAAGRHDIQLVNDTLGYHATKTIQVPAGKVLPLSIELPQGVANLNALPWAEVWIDGRRVGETPMGNVPLAIGPHEIVFRHPQLGEKRQAVSVTLSAPVRLSVDMKK